MNNESLYTLVNFRASTELLESFDRICFLSGKTRTQVLSEMMKHRVSTVGPKLVSKIAERKLVSERLKTAVEAESMAVASDRPRQWSIGVKRRLKSFSNFDKPDVLDAR